jgi:glycine betaine/proline transport system permease protein
MWEDTMKTISMIFVCTVIAILVGIPTGILMAKSNRLQSVISPVLDIMQTMPSFVYLIPVVMLLGIGRVPGLIAVVIYAIPPIIRLTNLGIRQVDRDVLEAADAFGSSPWQKLKNVQLPLALPTIMAGINQTIMMALAMVVIASMIGVQGLGQPVLKAISNQYFTLGIFNGMAIVGIAIIFDRISQAYGARLQKHLEITHGQ